MMRFAYFLIGALSWPLASFAQRTTEHMSPESIRVATWAWILVFSLMGWICSSLPKLAGWQTGQRLQIVQGVATSISAGVVSHVLAVMAGQAEMLAFIAALGGGWLGPAALEKFFGRQPAPPPPQPDQNG